MKKLIAVAVLSVVALSGCATAPDHLKNYGEKQPNTELVVIHREDTYINGLANWRVTANGRPVGMLPIGGTFNMYLPLGDNDVRVSLPAAVGWTAPWNGDSQQFRLEQGKPVRLEATMTPMIANIHLYSVHY